MSKFTANSSTSLKQLVWDTIKGHAIVYTQPLDTAALHVADTQGGEILDMSAINIESPSHTSFNDDTYIWRGEGKETVCWCS